MRRRQLPQPINIRACRFEIISLERRLGLRNELRHLWRILGRVSHNRRRCRLRRLVPGTKHFEAEKQHNGRDSSSAPDHSGEALRIQLF